MMKNSLDTFAERNVNLNVYEMTNLRGGDTFWDWVKKFLGTTAPEEDGDGNA